MHGSVGGGPLWTTGWTQSPYRGILVYVSCDRGLEGQYFARPVTDAIGLVAAIHHERGTSDDLRLCGVRLMKSSATDFARSAAPAAALARSRSRKQRFLITGTAALAVIAVVMGVSFLDSSGTAALSISSSSSTLVYPLVHSGSGTTSLP